MRAAATQPSNQRQSLTVAALSNVFRLLESLGDTAQTRALRARARSYENTLASWTAVPPTSLQRDTLFELVMDLSEKTVALRSGATHLPR